MSSWLIDTAKERAKRTIWYRGMMRNYVVWHWNVLTTAEELSARDEKSFWLTYSSARHQENKIRGIFVFYMRIHIRHRHTVRIGPLGSTRLPPPFRGRSAGRLGAAPSFGPLSSRAGSAGARLAVGSGSGARLGSVRDCRCRWLGLVCLLDSYVGRRVAFVFIIHHGLARLLLFSSTLVGSTASWGKCVADSLVCAGFG